MKKLFLNKQSGNTRLLIFFNGWGMDENVCSHLESGNRDVLMFYDYGTIDAVNIAMFDYERIDLIAWSLGVWSAARSLNGCRDGINSAVAVNGTLDPISTDYGIAPEVFTMTAKNWSEISRKKFNRRLCRKDHEFFEAHSSKRNCENQQTELLALAQDIAAHKLSGNNFFDCALTGSDDYIFPAAAQQRFWTQDNTRIHPLAMPHYPFAYFKSWQEILDFAQTV